MKRYILIILALLFPVLTALVAQNPGDHLGSYKFKIEIDGAPVANFQSVGGIGGEIEVLEYQNPGENVVRKRPGRVKYGDITLKKGYVTNTELFDWWKATADDPVRVQRRTVSIMLLDAVTENPLQTWDLFECWPSKWKVSGFDGKGSDVMTEEIQIVTENVIYKPG